MYKVWPLKPTFDELSKTDFFRSHGCLGLCIVFVWRLLFVVNCQSPCAVEIKAPESNQSQQDGATYLNVTVLKGCRPRYFETQNITVRYRSLSGDNDQNQTHCQLQVDDKKHVCSPAITYCTCADEGNKTVYRVVKNVTDPDGEVWYITATSIGTEQLHKTIRVAGAGVRTTRNNVLTSPVTTSNTSVGDNDKKGFAGSLFTSIEFLLGCIGGLLLFCCILCVCVCGLCDKRHGRHDLKGPRAAYQSADQQVETITVAEIEQSVPSTTGNISESTHLHDDGYDGYEKVCADSVRLKDCRQGSIHLYDPAEMAPLTLTPVTTNSRSCPDMGLLSQYVHLKNLTSKHNEHNIKDCIQDPDRRYEQKSKSAKTGSRTSTFTNIMTTHQDAKESIYEEPGSKCATVDDAKQVDFLSSSSADYEKRRCVAGRPDVDKVRGAKTIITRLLTENDAFASLPRRKHIKETQAFEISQSNEGNCSKRTSYLKRSQSAQEPRLHISNASARSTFCAISSDTANITGVMRQTNARTDHESQSKPAYQNRESKTCSVEHAPGTSSDYVGCDPAQTPEKCPGMDDSYLRRPVYKPKNGRDKTSEITGNQAASALGINSYLLRPVYNTSELTENDSNHDAKQDGRKRKTLVKAASDRLASRTAEKSSCARSASLNSDVRPPIIRKTLQKICESEPVAISTFKQKLEDTVREQRAQQFKSIPDILTNQQPCSSALTWRGKELLRTCLASEREKTTAGSCRPDTSLFNENSPMEHVDDLNVIDSDGYTIMANTRK